MAHPRKKILPFRIPFFRIFYSTTYTTLFLVTLFLLAITPASMLYTAIENEALQYIFMIGGVYIITALLAIFIYSSRLYTNRSVLAGIGKAYIPIEDGEVGKSVRRLIVGQLERSAIVAWEARPRDLKAELVRAEQAGILPQDTEGSLDDNYTVGDIVPVDPKDPPWGHVQNPGWTAPGQAHGNLQGNLQFDTVIAELPNLIEAQAVSLAPALPTGPGVESDGNQADPVVVEALRRQGKMGLRQYLTQLSYLGLINPPSSGHVFLDAYEQARFGGLPCSQAQFEELMANFALLLEGISGLSSEIVTEIRLQAREGSGSVSGTSRTDPSSDNDRVSHRPASSTSSSSSPHTISSMDVSPVTARTMPSRAVTPFIQQHASMSIETIGSVLVRSPESNWGHESTPTPSTRNRRDTSSSEGDYSTVDGLSLRQRSDTGSVLRYDIRESTEG